ncbi:MAG: endopeptidase La [Lachnospiraceae bacterium]|nr:endopeptidase La [Lachnospiraceae bacterium]
MENEEKIYNTEENNQTEENSQTEENNQPEETNGTEEDNEADMLTLPMVPLRGMVAFPEISLYFDVVREKSVRAVEQAMDLHRQLFVVCQKYVSTDDPDEDDLETIGTIVRIRQVSRLSNKNMRVAVQGVSRAVLCGVNKEDGYLSAQVREVPAADEDSLERLEKESLRRHLEIGLAEYLQSFPKVDGGLVEFLEKNQKLGSCLDFTAATLPLPVAKKQQVLNCPGLPERCEQVCQILADEAYIGKAQAEFGARVKERVDKQQKEYMLREQMRVIKEELGEDPAGSDADQFESKVEQLQASDEVKQKIYKEIKRLRSTAGNTAEASVERNYIEMLLDMPWDKMSEECLDIHRAEEILERDHYGLEKVKERILEFLAVRAYHPESHSSILCLVGPPGTGKTSIVRSVAEALQKEYVRISLGGLHDEAEIRGHRKTYIGAMPGRIAAAIRQAGVKNPVLLLDEIDKVSRDYRGDAYSALLEVLDSEQNRQFRDHYLELPLDLSEVLFIATANDTSDIPSPLLDRMDVIQISGYTANEKFHIAREHLVPKQAGDHGMENGAVEITDEAIRKLIAGYTREAGVRNLERCLADLYRKAARKFVSGTAVPGSLCIDAPDLKDYLGKEKYDPEQANQKPEIGIVRGLAWTSVGGVTLEIQVNTMPGKGDLKLTGQMGEVMQESAQIAYSYVRSIAGDYGVAEDYFEKHDFHLHIPEGAVPKDGPSAGITMASALLSAVAGIPADHLTAMTGEINLRGRVLPIGGLKEKMLAANMAGMKQVLIPLENKKDLEEMSEEIIGDMKIIPVSHMKEVLAAVLVQ